MTQKILITGAGGPAALAFARSIAERQVEVWMADMDPFAPGLFTVPAERRLVVPAGNDPGFADYMVALCQREQFDVLVPTVDAELETLASSAARFTRLGTQLMTSPASALAQTLDKWAFHQAMTAAGLPMPEAALFDDTFVIERAVAWGFPVIVKPRRGSGSRGVRIVHGLAELQSLERSDDRIVQSYLPGAEYSIDVLSGPRGCVVAAVPRERIRVDSGVAVVSRTRRDVRFEKLGACVVETLGLRWINNVQVKEDATGRPRVLEVNPRSPGTLELTVASGVNMPALALAALKGAGLPVQKRFREVACVRWLVQEILSPDELLSTCGLLPAADVAA